MAHKHKLLATPSSQAQVACPESMIDRFSNLPDEIVHRILKSFDFERLIRVCRVSKRCRELCLSAPSLNFSEFCSDSLRQMDRLNSFDRFLIHRGDNKIQNLRIHVSLCSNFADEMFRVITWIHIAARCNVEVLDLELLISQTDMTSFELPSCIFLCGSLRSLSVDMCTVLKAPSFACSTTLQHLNLTNVGLDEGFSKWFSSSCKCIKELQLDTIRTENVTIESSSLESFRFVSRICRVYHLAISGEKLENIHIEWGYVENCSRSLNIVAPNLKYFKWIGNVLNHQSLGKLPCLEKAEISLFTLIGVPIDFDNAFEFLCSICKVKVLILSDETTKALFQEGSVPVPFDNISLFRMRMESFSDDVVPGMVSLLRGMSNLSSLHLEYTPSILNLKPKARGRNRKYWKSQNLNFTDQLKEVTIELTNGFNSMELARYIVEHSQNLEKMVIVYSPNQSYVITKVKQSKMASNATIVFHKKTFETKYKRGIVLFERYYY